MPAASSRTRAYKVSGGLHGVGVSVVNALSEWLELEIWRNGQVHTQRYERGTPMGDLYITGVTEKRGTKVTFKPDTTVFETTEYSFETLSQRLRELAFLNAGVTISIDDERDGRSHRFLYQGGIREFVEYLNKNRTPVNEKPILHDRRARRHRSWKSRCSGTTATRKRRSRSRTTSTRSRAARTSPGSARR